jgi:hypothetical protein
MICFLSLQVVSGLHLLRCMWKIVCKGELLPCLFEGIFLYGRYEVLSDFCIMFSVRCFVMKGKS